MRFISYHEVEQRSISDRVRLVIVGKFSMRDFVCSRTGVIATEDPKVCFSLLVDMFCFTIRLGVIDSGDGEVVIEKFTKLLGEDRGKLWTSV